MQQLQSYYAQAQIGKPLKRMRADERKKKYEKKKICAVNVIEHIDTVEHSILCMQYYCWSLMGIGFKRKFGISTTISVAFVIRMAAPSNNQLFNANLLSEKFIHRTNKNYPF